MYAVNGGINLFLIIKKVLVFYIFTNYTNCIRSPSSNVKTFEVTICYLLCNDGEECKKLSHLVDHRHVPSTDRQLKND